MGTDFKNILADIYDNLKNNNYVNEEAVRVGIVVRILEALKQPIFNPNLVCYEYSVNKLDTNFETKNGRLDVAIFSQTNADLADIYIEIKAVGKLNIQDGETQLHHYTFEKHAKIAILTDGNTWIFYLPRKQQDVGIFSKCKFLQFDLLNDSFSLEDKAVFFEKFLSPKYYETDEVIAFAEELFEQKNSKKWKLLFCEFCYPIKDRLKYITDIKETLLKYCEDKKINTNNSNFQITLDNFVDNISKEIEDYENKSSEEQPQIISNNKNITNIETIYQIEKHCGNAYGKYENNSKRFIVLKGSIGDCFTDNYKYDKGGISVYNERKKMLEDGFLELIDKDKDIVKFVKDYTFSSISRAACMVVGYSENGKRRWEKT